LLFTVYGLFNGLVKFVINKLIHIVSRCERVRVDFGFVFMNTIFELTGHSYIQDLIRSIGKDINEASSFHLVLVLNKDKANHENN